MTRHLIKIFIGYDSRYPMGYEVCKKSIERFSGLPIEPLVLDDLRKKGLFWGTGRGSTEFAYTRFLVPYLKGFYGIAIFIDGDFLWTDDPATALDYVDFKNAVSVVQHDIKEENLPEYKMNGEKNYWFERKNWSSFMIFNCEHDHCKKLLPEYVSNTDGIALHRLDWAENQIGALPREYNYLVNYHKIDRLPKGIHYTDGGPWLPDYSNCEYSELWKELYVQ